MALNLEELTKGFNPIIEKLNGFNLAQKIGVFVGTLVMIAGLYVWLLYIPKFKEVEALNQQDKKLIQDVTVARAKTKKLPKLRAELEQRRGEYNSVMNALPDSKEIPGLLSSISASAKESGLALFKITPGGEKKQEFYSEIPISIDIRGDYHQIAVFFDKVSKFTRVVDIKTANIAAGSDGSLQAQCNAVTYRFLKDNASNKKKKK